MCVGQREDSCGTSGRGPTTRERWHVAPHPEGSRGLFVEHDGSNSPTLVPVTRHSHAWLNKGLIENKQVSHFNVQNLKGGTRENSIILDAKCMYMSR